MSSMKRIFLYVLIIWATDFLFSACGQRAVQSLFNGKNLNNWVVKGTPEDLEQNFWKTGNDYIEANSLGIPDHDYVWLVSEEEYEDFELTFEFQAFRESPGNSGIQIRSRYDDEEYWLHGPQIDIHPPGSWRTGMMWDETKGNQRWIFPEVPEGEWVDSTMMLNPVTFYFSDGDPSWNVMRVRVMGTRIEAWLNGIKITDYRGAGVLDDDLHNRLEVGTSGHIAFQIHSGDELKIRFRNIFLREL